MADFFTKEVAHAYDERNKKLMPIAENMHFLIRLILKDVPNSARILCVGVGTGAEILSLANEYPEWSFVGVDPSASMLEVCRERLESAGVMDRCQLIHGYIQDVVIEEFDAVLAVLVGHFIKKEERLDFYENIRQRMRTGGYFMNTEISFDLDSEQFPSMIEQWKQVQILMGGTEESLKKLPDQMRNILSVLPYTEVENLFRKSGFAMPVRFFQAFMISGWYAKKTV